MEYRNKGVTLQKGSGIESVMAGPVVMISHTALEKNLATAWQALLCSVFDLTPAQIKFSSDPRGAVGAKKPFADTIEEWVRSARTVISLQSPISRSRPWMLWEAGLAKALGKELFVVIYEPRATQKEDRIFGNLGTPLDAMQQFIGSERGDISKILNQLQHGSLSDCAARFDEVASAIAKYHRAVLKYERRWVKRRIIYETRIALKFSEKQRKTLRDKGIISPDVEVKGIESSLRIFGFETVADQTLTWGAFVSQLETTNVPWPGSAARWARGLGRPLQNALQGKLIDGPEGLPLYYDAREEEHHSYRPSVVLRDDYGEVTYFVISFTHMPPVLVASPRRQKTKVLLNYMDFCRMMRWGVLERERFRTYFEEPDHFEQKEGEERLREFLEAIMTIRTDFWNRGLAPEDIKRTIDERDLSELELLEHSYFQAMDRIDPKDKGVAPTRLPEFSTIKSAYADLLRINKDYYLLLYRSLESELEALNPSLDVSSERKA